MAICAACCPERQHPCGFQPYIFENIRVRLFFALWPPDAIRDHLDRLASSCVQGFGGRAMRAETLHLTLAFLGEVDQLRLSDLLKLAARIEAPAFPLSVDQLGFWSRQRVLWAGCSAPNPALNTLVAALWRALHDAGFGFADAARPFVPHITLVRKVPPEAVSAQLPAIETVNWSCSGFSLIQSELSAAGPRYTELASFPFLRS